MHIFTTFAFPVVVVVVSLPPDSPPPSLLPPGRTAGIYRGFEYGQEIGFYEGALRSLEAVRVADPDRFSPRVRQYLEDLRELLAALRPLGAEDESLTDVLERTRARFRQIMASLGLWSHVAQAMAGLEPTEGPPAGRRGGGGPVGAQSFDF